MTKAGRLGKYCNLEFSFILLIFPSRAFGYTPLVGVATIKHYGQYRTTYDALEKESLAAKNFGKENIRPFFIFLVSCNLISGRKNT